MNTLEEAWQWYESTERQLRVVQRLGDRHWNALPWNGPLGLDPRLSDPTDTRVQTEARIALKPLDDLAVLVLFSVFEAIVRAKLVAQIRDEKTAIRHAVLRQAADLAEDGIENGSFKNNVLDALKLPPDADKNLIEHVNQVRKYRNYVAHGKRGRAADFVNPRTAYERLQQFLQLLDRTGE